MLPLGKPDGPVWHFKLSGFPVLEPSYPTTGRRSCNGRLLYSSLRGQNLQLVLTILDGSASAVESMVHTTPPKVDTSSVEAPWLGHWRPDREVRRRIVILLTMIPTF
jgi:hypothetical protein